MPEPSMRTHVLKTGEPWFSRLVDGTKTAELRKHDRDFQIGDTLYLVKWEPFQPAFEPGRVEYVRAVVSHILPATVFEALREGWSMLSLHAISAHECSGEQFAALVVEQPAVDDGSRS